MSSGFVCRTQVFAGFSGHGNSKYCRYLIKENVHIFGIVFVKKIERNHKTIF